MLFIGWIIKITPFANISLIAAAIGEQNDIGAVMEQLGRSYFALSSSLNTDIIISELLYFV